MSSDCLSLQHLDCCGQYVYIWCNTTLQRCVSDREPTSENGLSGKAVRAQKLLRIPRTSNQLPLHSTTSSVAPFPQQNASTSSMSSSARQGACGRNRSGHERRMENGVPSSLCIFQLTSLSTLSSLVAALHSRPKVACAAAQFVHGFPVPAAPSTITVSSRWPCSGVLTWIHACARGGGGGRGFARRG